MQCVNEILAGVKGMNNSCYTKPLNVTNIAESNGKVIVTFDNGMYVQAELDIVDASLKEALTVEQSDKVKQLEETINKLTGSLIDIQEFDGDVSYKAISKDFKL